MIRVSVMYPNQEGKKFDHEYYATIHFDLVKQHFNPHGLVSCAVDTGLGGGAPGSSAPFISIGNLMFNNMEDFQAAMAVAEPVMADIVNFTDIEPQIQISEINEL